MKKATGIVLAGGKSKRMGKPKQELSYKDYYLIDIIIKNLERHFDQIILVSNDSEFLERRFGDLDHIKITSDLIKEKGPLGGLFTGLRTSETKDNFLIACDMPYFSHPYLDYLLERPYRKALVYKDEQGLEPFFALYKKDLSQEIFNYLEGGKKSFKGFLEIIEADIIDKDAIGYIEDYEKIFRNLNYPEDFDSYVKERLNERN
ncbi:MAG: molybdenum cofactor guanylyltransferase [Anaerococcus sp.]|nr:molybdenum cofactor guanylyltransferase [Anaerococcus sp.]